MNICAYVFCLAVLINYLTVFFLFYSTINIVIITIINSNNISRIYRDISPHVRYFFEIKLYVEAIM